MYVTECDTHCQCIVVTIALYYVFTYYIRFQCIKNNLHFCNTAQEYLS